MRKADDMLIVYNPEISPRQLEEQLLKNDYSTQIIAQFLANHNTGDRVFCLRHDIVGEYLGYGKSENYKEFKKLFTGTKRKPSKFLENIDYKIVSLKSILRFEGIPSNLKTNNNRGKDSQTKIIIFSRSTYNRICNRSRKPKAVEISDSFCKMYEILFKYIIAIRSEVINQNRDNKARESVVKARVDEMVDQRVSKTNSHKLSKELLDTKRKNVELKDKISSDANKKREYEETIKDLLGKISAHEIMYQELEDKSETKIQEYTDSIATKMKENNDTIKDLNRKVDHMVLMSAELEECKTKCKKLGKRKDNLVVKYRGVKSELDIERESKEKAEKKLRKYVKKQGDSHKYKEKIKRLEEEVETNEVKCKELLRKRLEMYKRYTKSVKSNKELRESIIKLEQKIDNQNKIIESLKNNKDDEESEDEGEDEGEKEGEKAKIDVKEVRMKKLKGMTLMNLKDLCKSKGVGGYSKYNKSGLMEFMVNNEKIYK
jgi:hypothetical protein